MLGKGKPMKCIDCGKKIGALDERCPYCSTEQYDDEPAANVQIARTKLKRNKQSVFSEEECLIYGIHPDDETYRKTMELNVLAKKYK